MTRLNHLFILLLLSAFSFPINAAGLVINSATVDADSSTSVSANALISVQVNLSERQTWRSTRWIITDSFDSTVIESCQTHSSRRGSSRNSFNITAPNLDGSYDVSFTAYENDRCSEIKGTAFILTNGIIVGSGNTPLSPELQLHMDEKNWTSESNEVIDSSGNNHHGTAINGALTKQLNPAISTNPGSCAYGLFDGQNDYIEIPHSADLNGTTALTYTAWINAATWSGVRQIMAKSVHGGGSGRAQMGIFSESGVLKGRAETTAGRVEIRASLPTVNSWHHIALIYSDTSFKLYIDGVSAAATTFSSRSLNTTTDPVNISKRVGSNQYFFDGSIDEVQIYTQSLTQQQVIQVMAETHACDVPPVPLAEYHFDEDSWDGTTDEVGDTSGNNHHGTAANGLSTQQLDSAIPGNPGTCGTGQFDGVDDYIVLPSVANLTGSFTFSAWVKSTQNTRGRIFADDDKNQGGYALSLNEPSSGKLRFYNRSVNPVILDTSSRVLPQDSNWYFVTAVHNVATKQRFIYVDGELKASDTYTGIWGQDAGKVSIGSETNASLEGAGFAAFKGRIDEAKIFDGALSQVQIQGIMNETHPCDSPEVASNFNCVVTGGNPLTGRLYTKLTNQDFSLDIAALQDATTLASTFSNTVTVELVDASSGSCSSHPVLSPEITQSLNFSGSSGVKTTAAINSDRAYRNLKCRVTDNSYPSPIIGCSTDAFSIRPHSLSISSPLTNASNSGSPTEKSGTNFEITATTNTPNYNGTPLIISTNIEPHTGAVRTGDITGSFPPADAITGNSTGLTFTYSDVGNFRFLDNGVVDSSFTAIDQSAGDCLNNASNSENSDGKIGCNITNLNSSDYIGRFVPDHFEVVINDQGSFGGTSYACSTFNYVGQNFTYNAKPELTVTAYNGLSPQSVTQNYTGNYAKLAVSDFILTPPTHDANKLGVDAINKVKLTWSVAMPELTDNNNGSHTFIFGDDDFQYLQHSNSLVAPYTNAVKFEFTAITDSDAVTSINMPQSLTPSGALIRFGRLNIDNAHGSELAPLMVPLGTEYFNGSNWSVNTLDNCTNLSLQSNILLSNSASGTNRPGNTAMVIESSNSTASLLNSPFSSGQGTLSFTAPGEDNQGYIDIKGALTGFEWLQFDWNSNGSFTDNPSGRVSFGLYNGNDRLIFRREVY